MSLDCGEEILLRDINGANLTRFVWLCRGRWLALQREVLPLDHPLNMRNGTMGDWRWLLSYLVKAAKLSPQGHEYNVASLSKGPVMLGPVVRVSDLAPLLGMPEKDVRAELKDYVLTVPDEAG